MNGYIAFYKGKQKEVWANSSYQAQQQAAEKFGLKPKDAWKVTVVIAEKEGQPVVHLPQDVAP